MHLRFELQAQPLLLALKVKGRLGNIGLRILSQFDVQGRLELS